MPLSGYTTALPAEVLLNPAIIRIGSTALGVTKGGVSWDPEMEVASIAFDGKRSKHIKGLERVSMRGGKLSGTLIQLATAAQIKNIDLGATTATGGTGVTSIITPKDAGILFATGDYLTDVRAIWEIGNTGTYFSIYMACAVCLKYAIKGGDAGEGDVSFEFDAVLDMPGGAGVGDSAYVYELRSALPALT